LKDGLPLDMHLLILFQGIISDFATYDGNISPMMKYLPFLSKWNKFQYISMNVRGKYKQGQKIPRCNTVLKELYK
jgi:hypothetical protein